MNLITLDDLAEMMRLSRQYVRDKLVKRGDFPRPSLSLSQKSRLWDRTDVESWIARSKEDLAR